MNDYLFRRRHPEYLANESSWRHCMEAFAGGSSYIEKALIRHVSEIDIEFAERRRRAYYFNYPRGIARRITQYALSVDPVRSGADPALVEDWNRNGLRVNEVMRQLSTMLTIYGRAWLWVDAPSFDHPADRSRVSLENLRPYVRLLSPLQVTDWAEGPDGKLLWAVIQEEVPDNSDPMKPPVCRRMVRLLEKNQWHLFAPDPTGCRKIASGPLPGGRVPLVSVCEPDGFGLKSSHWFEDIVRISEAILNNESESQMNMVKQMFGLLVVSESFARGARQHSSGEGGNFASTVARSAAIIESVEEKGISRYITPSGVPGTLLRQENEALKRELYDLAGLMVNHNSREGQSADSKAWDFQNAGQFLASRADLLEQAEQNCWQLFNAFDPSIPVPQVVYNRKFALQELEKSIAGLLQLSSLEGGPAYRRMVNRAAVEMLDSLTPMPEKEKSSLLSENDSMAYLPGRTTEPLQ